MPLLCQQPLLHPRTEAISGSNWSQLTLKWPQFLGGRRAEKQAFVPGGLPDLGCADFQRARATTPPVRNRLRIPAARHNRERALLRDELVSLRRWRILRRRCTETSSARRSARSRLWPAVGIPRRFLTGGVVARALWKSAHPRSGISRTDDLYFSESRFFRKVQVWDERAKCLNFGAGISG